MVDHHPAVPFGVLSDELADDLPSVDGEEARTMLPARASKDKLHFVVVVAPGDKTGKQRTQELRQSVKHGLHLFVGSEEVGDSLRSTSFGAQLFVVVRVDKTPTIDDESCVSRWSCVFEATGNDADDFVATLSLRRFHYVLLVESRPGAWLLNP
jgi:hypothetical protein